MTRTELKEFWKVAGVSEKEAQVVESKYNVDTITDIVERSENPREAMEALHAYYPQLEVEDLQKQMDFIQDQMEAALEEKKRNASLELTEEELSNVNGGGFFGSIGNWFKDNWKKTLVVGALVVGAALVVTGVGCVAGGVIAATAASATSSTGMGLMLGGGLSTFIGADFLFAGVNGMTNG